MSPSPALDGFSNGYVRSCDKLEIYPNYGWMADIKMNRRHIHLVLTAALAGAVGLFLGFWLGSIPFREQLRLTGGPSGQIARGMQNLSAQLSDRSMGTMDVDAVIQQRVREADNTAVLGALMFCQMSPEYRASAKRAAKTMDLNGYIQNWGGSGARKARSYILASASNGPGCTPFNLEI
jgi:hypothetical protein